MMQSNVERYSPYGKATKKRGNGDLGQLAQREMAISGQMVISSLLRGLALALVAGLFVGFLGPFGTFENLSLGWRLGFWVSAIVGGFLFHIPLYWLSRFITQSKGWPIWVAIIGSAIVAALPTTVLVNGIAITLLNAVTTDSVLTLYPMVLAISVPLQIIGDLIAPKGEFERSGAPVETRALWEPIVTTQSAAASVPAALALQATEDTSASIISAPTHTPSPFFARLPGHIGRDLLCLQMEDHYVRAWTRIGSELILMRMADATRELSSIDGLLVHRSFWVARAAVEGWTRDGKNLTLHLSIGKNIPVARVRQSQIKAAGWLVGARD